MKKSMLVFLLIVVTFFTFLSCSSKMTEKEYYDQAYKYMGNEKWSDAEASFQAIMDQYPQGELYPKAMFMVAYINANHIKNLEKAKKIYTEFLKKYPNHDLADDAKYEIENLGKNVDELPFMQDQQSNNN